MKITTTVTLDIEPYTEAKKRGMKLSSFFNQCLYSVLKMEEQGKVNIQKLEEVKVALAAAKAKVEELEKMRKKSEVITYGKYPKIFKSCSEK